MDVAELIGALFNITLVVMIVATMVSAGFTTTFSAIGRVLSGVLLVVLVLVTGLVLRPLRDAGVVSAQQDYLSPEGLVALGAMLGLEVALDA